MTIKDYIIKNGPCLSSELIKLYKSKEVSDDAIRKRLSRVGSPINRISGLFQKGQIFFYHKDQYQNEIYFENLRKAIKNSARRYYSLIIAIEFHNGYIHKDHLASYGFSPIMDLKSHVRFDVLIEKLKELNIVYEENGFYSLNEMFTIRSRNNYRYYKAIELSKNVTLEQFEDITKNTGIISYESAKRNSEYCKFQFCFTAPSYVNGITKKSTNITNPAFVLADVLIGNDINMDAVDFFLRKIDIISTQSKCNFLPFLIVDSISQEALDTLKKKGIIVGFVEKLFGSEYEELLKSLISTVTNAGAILKENPDAYVTLIEQFDKLVVGQTNNLKGDLFELAVGYYYSNLCQRLDIGRVVSFNSVKREIDVVAFFQDKIVLCECKAYKTQVGLDIIEKWVTDKIPIIYKSLNSIENSRDIIFEFWSTSGFTAESIEYLESRRSTTAKYRIEYYSEKEMMEKARKSKAKKIIDIMRAYFIKKP